MYGRNLGEKEENADYGAMVRPGKQDVAPYKKGLSGKGIRHERFLGFPYP